VALRLAGLPLAGLPLVVLPLVQLLLAAAVAKVVAAEWAWVVRAHST
jgi:hypothetical protein